MEQQQFQENVSEWIRVMNARMRELEEQVADISSCVEEDLLTLSYQYNVIKDLKNEIVRLERKLYEMAKK